MAKKNIQKVSPGQSQLFYWIIEEFGGPAEVASQMKLPLSDFANWRKKGCVPLHRIGEVARFLGISIYVFNYEEVTKLLGKALPWKDVVKNSGLSAIRVKSILALVGPRTPSEIV